MASNSLKDKVDIQRAVCKNCGTALVRIPLVTNNENFEYTWTWVHCSDESVICHEVTTAEPIISRNDL